jgi:hypothetical protein
MEYRDAKQGYYRSHKLLACLRFLRVAELESFARQQAIASMLAVRQLIGRWSDGRFDGRNFART